jgi:glycosyltransferase involved in cell wall biosynthesis
LLILHQEQVWLAGAEKVLVYFLQALETAGQEFVLAVAPDSKMAGALPASIAPVFIPGNQRFSLLQLGRQVKGLLATARRARCDLIHAWAARDWELASLVSRLSGCPALGTLHDHPQARFITLRRQRLMRMCARWGLRRVACVSEAVRAECCRVGYPASRLAVVHNGLPGRAPALRPADDPACVVGFLGVFSERKGLRDLFRILEELARCPEGSWRVKIAGGASDAAAEALLTALKLEYAAKPWWPRVEFLGWVHHPVDFLQSLDVLLVPSSEFDPLPTVLLEAGFAGVPVLASRVGGVPEIVVDGVSGLLFDPGDVAGAAQRLAALVQGPAVRRRLGAAAAERVATHFSASRMWEDYRRLYTCILAEHGPRA